MRIKVQYSTMIVNDLQESVEFYRDVLGFREGYHVDLPENAGITIMESEDGASVELIESKQFETGLYSVGTDVEDLDETLAELKAKGVEPITPVVETSVGRQAFILDPNGIRICLIEHTEEYSNLVNSQELF